MPAALFVGCSTRLSLARLYTREDVNENLPAHTKGARLDQAATASGGDTVGTEEPLDLFRGTVDYVLASW